MSTFYERFKALCRENGTSPNGVAKALHFSSGAVTSWNNGTMPKVEALLKIAGYFGVSTGYLIGETDDPTPKQASAKEQLNSAIDRMSREELLDLIVRATEKLRDK